MSLLNSIKEFQLPAEHKIPTAVKERLKRGREEMLRDANKRRLCVRFERGETYSFLGERGGLLTQSTITSVGGKPPHRIRNTYNFLRPIVEGKVSTATQRIPGYEVLPTGTDPERVGAARLAERVAQYGYEKWNIRGIAIDVVKMAIAGGGEGFSMPYFDPNIGPFSTVQDPTTGEPVVVGQGEICIKTFGGNEVYWEPYVRFEDSRWWATEQAVPIDVVISYPGYLGGKLVPDAQGSDVPSDKGTTSNLVMVVEYYERPSMQNPRGRKVRIANGRQICPQEDYPLQNVKGEVLDEPCIHRLAYTHDPDGKRDLGLIWQLIDFQRTAQDCWNKLLEYKNRGLNPRMMAPVGSLLKRPDDEPGGIDWYRPTGGNPPEWEKPLQVPEALFRMLELAKSDMRSVAADEDIQAAPDVAAATIQQVLETSRARWGAFLGDCADWHARQMHHCLLLVARHYTEPRLLKIRGRFGPETIGDFRGSDLLDQQDVIVMPGTLEVRTREQIQTQIFAFADRGWVTPEAAMAAMNSGTGAEKLIESYELDVSRINRVIQKIRDGTVFEMPPRVQTDPLTGQATIDPQTGAPMQTPGWMPDEQDNLVVWKSVASDWMKTEEYEQLDPGLQEVARQLLQGIQYLQAQQQMRALQAQTAQAEQLGMDNAAKPQRAKPNPSMPGGPGPQPGPGAGPPSGPGQQ